MTVRIPSNPVMFPFCCFRSDQGRHVGQLCQRHNCTASICKFHKFSVRFPLPHCRISIHMPEHEGTMKHWLSLPCDIFILECAASSVIDKTEGVGKVQCIPFDHFWMFFSLQAFQNVPYTFIFPLPDPEHFLRNGNCKAQPAIHQSHSHSFSLSGGF